MRSSVRTALLSALGTAALGAGCASTTTRDAPSTGQPGAMTVDSVMVPGVAPGGDDLVQSGLLTLADGAAWETVTVAEWMDLAATTPEERQTGESGAYLGDAMRVVRLQPGGELLGQARYESTVPVGAPFETEVLHRFTGGGGRLDLIFSGEAASGGRAMPAEMIATFAFEDEGTAGPSGGLTVYLGELDNYPSEVAMADLPAGLDVGGFAHRYGVRYEPGRVVVLLDGEPIAEAAVRTGGVGPMTAGVRAYGPDGTAAYLLRWIFDALE